MSSTDPLDDVYSLPYLDGYILYLPKRSLVLGVEPPVHELLERLKRGDPVSTDTFSIQWLEALRRLGAFGKPAPPAEIDGPFQPTHVTLSLTTGCSLRCIYCYARAGESIRHMDPALAQASLEFVTANAIERGTRKFKVAFHGEGEPTYYWPLFTLCIEHAERLGRANGLEVEFSMSTNAVWGRAQRDFIADHFQHLSISLDGLPDVQDIQRPTISGKGSFRVVFDTMRALTSRGIHYGVRATVLPESVGRMNAFVEFVAAETTADALTLEPVFQSGRGLSLMMDKDRFYREFTDSYRAAQACGRSLGLDVTYSGCRPHVAPGRFCQAIGPDLNFVVMSNGLVSSCYEINDPQTDKGSLVVYGRFDPEAGKFSFDQEKLRLLRNHGVWNMPGCANCFAKWNCGGDCLARCDLTLAALTSGPDRCESSRCRLNRTLTLDELVRYAIVEDLVH